MLNAIYDVITDDAWLIMAIIWAVCYVPPMLVVFGTMWALGLRGGRWAWWDWLLLIVPFLTWVCGIIVDDSYKASGNYMFEPITVALAVPMVLLIKRDEASKLGRTIIICAQQITACAIALGVWKLFPVW